MGFERAIATVSVAMTIVSCDKNRSQPSPSPPPTNIAPAHAPTDVAQHRQDVPYQTNFSTTWYSVMGEILASNGVTRESFVEAIAATEEGAERLYFPLAAMLRCKFEAADLNGDHRDEIFVHVFCPPVPGATGNHPIYILQKDRETIIGDFWGREVDLGSFDAGYRRVQSSTKLNLNHYTEGTYAYKNGRYRLVAEQEWSPQPSER